MSCDAWLGSCLPVTGAEAAAIGHCISNMDASEHPKHLVSHTWGVSSYFVRGYYSAKGIVEQLPKELFNNHLSYPWPEGIRFGS